MVVPVVSSIPTKVVGDRKHLGTDRHVPSGVGGDSGSSLVVCHRVRTREERGGMNVGQDDPCTRLVSRAQT